MVGRGDANDRTSILTSRAGLMDADILPSRENSQECARSVNVDFGWSQTTSAFAFAQQNAPRIDPNTKRPLTHDLMISLLKAGKLHLDSVMIHSIEESTFQAVLKLHLVPQAEIKDDKTVNSLIEINARPSDAIALAVRSKCCIWMMESVVAQASIPVDPNADEEDQSQFKRFLDQLSPSALIKHLKDRESKSKDNFNFPDSESKSNQ